MTMDSCLDQVYFIQSSRKKIELLIFLKQDNTKNILWTPDHQTHLYIFSKLEALNSTEGLCML